MFDDRRVARQVGSERDARIFYSPPDVRAPETLRGLYERYCEHEARELLPLIPRDAFRQIYRQARREAQEECVEGERAGPLSAAFDRGGAMELAAQFARGALPLPPYEVWVPEYLANRRAYLERLGIAVVPEREAPVTVSIKTVGDGWYAALCVSRSADGWSGYIRFHRSEGDRFWHTSAVFRGEEIEEIRDRFQGFDENTLRAFLRSVLP